ncbi:MAG: hypothetical protein NTW08_01125 [Gammaproteobacteria bacterium]|nr:hypothetical protein [Gammaproteobacteria bacterium]
MFSRQEKTKDTSGDSSRAHSGFSLRMFDPRKPTDIAALNALIDSEIASKDEENEQLKPTFEKMTEWLKRYVKSPEFMGMYKEERSIELMAEATFW